METCEKENPYQVVTHVEINGVKQSDQQATFPIVEKLADKGLNSEVLLADTGYGSGENIVACDVEGVLLLAPVRDPDAPKKVDLRWEPFAVEEQGQATTVAPESADTWPELLPFETALEPGVEAPSPTTSSAEHLDRPAETDPVSTPAECLGLEAFRYNSTFSKVETCPTGHALGSKRL